MGRAKDQWKNVDVEAQRVPCYFDRALDKCGHCGGPLNDEPAAQHCRMCGRVYYLGGRVAAQLEWERSSGLHVPGLPTNERVTPGARTHA